MAERPNSPLFASVLGVTEPEGAIDDAGLLLPSQTPRLAGWRVCKQIPGAAVQTPG